MTTSSKSLSSVKLGERYGDSQTSKLFFIQKVRKAMESSKEHPLKYLVHVNEFTVGAMEDGKQGRSYDSKKKKAVIAIELTKMHQVKRFLRYINDYSCKSLTPIFEEHISKDADVFKDKWRGYEPLKNDFNTTQKESDKGKDFKKLHIIIHQIKTWLRTIPTHVSEKHVQKYFDEFAYHINRSQSKKTIWHNLILRIK